MLFELTKNMKIALVDLKGKKKHLLKSLIESIYKYIKTIFN